MKIYQIVNENNNLEEAPVGFMKKAFQSGMRYLGSQTAAGAEKVSIEANDIKKQLKQHMGASGIKTGQLTVDQLEDFLIKAGYGGMAVAELKKLRTAKKQASDARNQKIQNFGQKVGAGIAAAKSGIQAAKNTYSQRAPQESMFENEQEAPLTNKEVDQILLAVVRQAYAKNTQVKKGKYANEPSAEKPAEKPAEPAASTPPAKKSKPKISANVRKVFNSLSPEEQKQLIAAIKGS